MEAISWCLLGESADAIASSRSNTGRSVKAKFSDYGITVSGLAETMQTSKQTPYRYLKVLDGMGLVEKKKIGKEAFHAVSLKQLLELSNTQH